MKGRKRVGKMQINDLFKFILWHDINDSYSTDVCEQRHKPDVFFFGGKDEKSQLAAPNRKYGQYCPSFGSVIWSMFRRETQMFSLKIFILPPLGICCLERRITCSPPPPMTSLFASIPLKELEIHLRTQMVNPHFIQPNKNKTSNVRINQQWGAFP